MSAGAVFCLIANDGKADRMIMATKLLNTRIKDIMVARKMAGKADFTPTLVDLERTHILYVNAHFKPFAAIGFEYNKVRPQSGAIQPGGSMIFSIPQFGDFFYDMVCHIVMPQISGSLVPTLLPSLPVTAYEYNATTGYQPTGGAGHNSLYPVLPILTQINGGTVNKNQYQLTTVGGTPYGGKLPGPSGSPAIYGYLSYAWTDPFGTILAATRTGEDTNSTVAVTNAVSNYVRYCEYPGQFLFANVAFDVNGNPLDSYDRIASCMIEKFNISPNKKTGYNNLVGQEVSMLGYGPLQSSFVYDQEFLAPQSNITGNLIGQWDNKQSFQTVGLFNGLAGTPLNNNVTSSAPSSTLLNPNSTYVTPSYTNTSQTDVSRPCVQFVNGPQTPKQTQPPLELLVPLMFWFNRDVRLSIPSVSIPFGQRFITMELSDLQSNNNGNLIYETAGVYLRQSFDYDSTQTGQVPDTRTVQYTPWSGESAYLNGTSSSSATNWPGVNNRFPPSQTNQITLSQNMTAELYINNIFVNPEIHDIYIKRIGFSLIRVFRQQSTNISGSSLSDILLSQLKWPIEFMYVGLQPTWNLNTTNNTNSWRDWHRFTRQTNATTATTMQSNNYSEHHNYTREGTPSVPTPGAVSVFIGQTVQPTTYYNSVSTIDNMSLTSHGIAIFDTFSDMFYNKYIPYNYGGQLMNTPNDDPGVQLINFALFPGVYQPSGHLNISRARETYVNPGSNYVSNSNGKANFQAVAIAINFLLITDGSAVLRYST